MNNGEIGRLSIPVGLHAVLLCYMLNVLALKVIGCAVEQCYSTLAVSIMFCLPAIDGTIYLLYLSEHASVGESSGISRFIGAFLVSISFVL